MVKHMGLDPVGPIESEMYGNAAANIIAWMFPGTGLPVPAPPTGIYFSSDVPAQTLMGTKVSKAYGGLPMYVDTTGNAPFLGVGAPNVLLGLVQDEADFDTPLVPIRNATPKIGRNDPCPCGSGKKYKKCHIN